jgi:hypothetical protein
MPPDIQICVSDEKGAENGKSFEIGLYDTIGFRNPDLVQFLLEGIVENHTIFKIQKVKQQMIRRIPENQPKMIL